MIFPFIFSLFQANKNFSVRYTIKSSINLGNGRQILKCRKVVTATANKNGKLIQKASSDKSPETKKLLITYLSRSFFIGNEKNDCMHLLNRMKNCFRNKLKLSPPYKRQNVFKNTTSVLGKNCFIRIYYIVNE